MPSEKLQSDAGYSILQIYFMHRRNGLSCLLRGATDHCKETTGARPSVESTGCDENIMWLLRCGWYQRFNCLIHNDKGV